MSNFPAYKTKTFSPTQKFFVLDPNTGSPAFVQGSDLIAQITPSSNYVYAESTRTTAQATDYPVGALIETAGATSAGDNFAAVYLVVESGAGDFPMNNGNELLVIKGDELLRQQLATEAAGEGSDLVVKADTGETVTAALNKRTIYVGSVADLVATSGHIDGGQYSVFSYHPTYDVGGGDFVYDSAVSKTAHNGGTVIDPDQVFPTDWTNATQVSDWFTPAGSGSGCFVRKLGYLDTTAFGQLPGLFEANHTCINQAEASTEGHLNISDGQDFEVTGTVVLESSGKVYDWQGSVMSATSGGVVPLQISDTGYVFGSKFTNGEIQTSGTAGRTFSIPFGIAYCDFELSLKQSITNLELIKERYDGVSGVYDSKFYAKQWAITNNHTVHGFDLTSVDTGRVNGNTFSVERYDRSGTKQFFNIVCEASTNWNYDNKWIDSTFEVTNGGNIRALGARGFVCEDLRTWDLSVFNSGVTVAHLYDFDIFAGGLQSIGCRFINCGRTDGTLGSGLYDINFGDCVDSTIDQCIGNPSIGVTHNVNNKRCVIVHGIGQTIVNKLLSNSFFITASGLEGTLKNVAYPAETELTISAGVITPTQSRHSVDTEADASSDDLDTITAGENGQILTIRAINDARTVVVKNATGNIRLSGALDFSLDRVYDTLTLMYSGELSQWVEISRMEYP